MTELPATKTPTLAKNYFSGHRSPLVACAFASRQRLLQILNACAVAVLDAGDLRPASAPGLYKLLFLLVELLALPLCQVE
jgi:hypothetical protein